MTKSTIVRSRPAQSVLDFGIVAPGRAGPAVLADSLELAGRLDRLGYHRLWLSEHHESHFCWAVPEVMVAALAQRTRALRIGTAAVLLPVRNPLLLAESFRVLEALTPGRIDLGVCAAVPLDPVALAALAEQPVPDVAALMASFDGRLGVLLDYLRGRFPDGHRFACGATPPFVDAPPVWVMGSGPGSAATAAARGAHYAYSLFHKGSRQDPAVPAAYRERRPDGRVALAVSCISADTAAAAAAQRRLVEGWLRDDMRVVLSGTHDDCREQVLALAQRFRADEVILLHLWHDPARRVDAIEAMASLIHPLAEPVRA
ncbi:luciferase-like monooxygenase [Burkholderia pseudomallei]|uniref:LLM class flavin-dependent oxidoreductase n=1 Tax=Burkholderia pseudomallei TaxID=28450 RepID=UPI000055BC99|nr:LLM class flavin-dependent oxidoreductase [Burkholderia pseudomallei]EDS82908.1 luciferase-like monooxygenase [Burkholderia pseudomallei S13]CAJ9810512.1 luciferase-like monooxygenase [Burkholderia pseudomallei]CAJ9970215.1 luciferase-like monooxygenase [Burkholderia pseudomallei]CAJ9992577.1 luciferase-like monooxygenase [Burkholderia pseudomallei]CFL62948.1 luciferase-like monooxygenase [Burkholderia pseudomallei]